jgi:hypothetical protein
MWIVLSFKINQDYIAKVLCINRDKPEMHCNGNCILMQRIKASEENERKEIPQKLKEQKEIFYYLNISNWLLQSPIEENSRKQQLTFFYESPFTTAFVKGLFRPPKIGMVEA